MEALHPLVHRQQVTEWMTNGSLPWLGRIVTRLRPWLSTNTYLRPVLLIKSQMAGSVSQNFFPMLSKIAWKWRSNKKGTSSRPMITDEGHEDTIEKACLIPAPPFSPILPILDSSENNGLASMDVQTLYYWKRKRQMIVTRSLQTSGAGDSGRFIACDTKLCVYTFIRNGIYINRQCPGIGLHLPARLHRHCWPGYPGGLSVRAWSAQTAVLCRLLWRSHRPPAGSRPPSPLPVRWGSTTELSVTIAKNVLIPPLLFRLDYIPLSYHYAE